MSRLGVATVAQLQPELDVSDSRTYTISDGGETINIQRFAAQNPNASEVVIRCFPPSARTIIDPRSWIETTFNIVFTGDSSVPGVPILNLGATDAPRAWPLHSTTKTLTVEINGTSFSSQPQQWLQVASRVGVYQRDLNTWTSTAPTATDNFQEYYDATNPNQALSIRNMLSDYNGGTQWSLGRGAHPIELVSNTIAGAEVNFTTCEPILGSPFFPNVGGISGVNTLSLSYSFSNLRRIWSHGADPARSQITGMTVTITRMEAHMRWITPKPTFTLPQRLVLPYISYNIFPSGLNATAPGASGVITNTSINLSSVPDKIYIMVKRNGAEQFNSDNCYLYTDTCCRIDSVTIQFGNISGLLSTYSAQDLYKMSSNNDLNMPFADWNGSTNAGGQLIGAGSFCCIDIARDLGCPTGIAPGSDNMPNLTVTVNYTNFGAQARTVELLTVIKYSGLTIIEQGGQVTQVNAPLTLADVMNAEKSSDHEVHDMDQVMIGGKWWSKLGKSWKNIDKYLKKHNTISRFADITGMPVAGEVAKAFGYGVETRGTSLSGRSLGGARVY